MDDWDNHKRQEKKMKTLQAVKSKCAAKVEECDEAQWVQEDVVI